MHESPLPASHVRFGPFELDVRSGELRKGSTRLKVPDQSIEILKALLERRGELVTREQLRGRLWPSNTFVDFEHGLNAAVRRLREALGDSADTPKFIETLPRRGYRFIGPIDGASTVVPCGASTKIAGQPTSSETDVAPLDLQRPASAARSHLSIRRIRLRHLVLAGSAMAVAIGLWVGHRVRDNAASSVRPAPAKSIPVTSLPGQEVDPAVSPDGNQVAFAWDADTGENFDIYVKLIDAGEPVRLTTDPAADRTPAWSPDGRRIAFLRSTTGGRAVVVIVPALGGPERRLNETETTPQSGAFWRKGLSWTPDGRSLLFVDRGLSSTNSAIFVYSLETGERQQLTRPPPESSDAVPVISPDGRHLAFLRWNAASGVGSVFVQQLDGLRPLAEPRRLTYDNRASSLDWDQDSGSIVYDMASENWGGSESGLWRVPIAGGQPQPVVTNVPASRPSVARNGRRVVYQSTTTDTNIWRMLGPQARERAAGLNAPERLIASTFFDMAPQFSPDGQRIVFVSLRSGSYEIWVSKSDGSQPMQLTTFGAVFMGSPRWSSNGRLIAFDSNRSGSYHIYVVAAEGGRVRAVTNGVSNNARPSWSQDERWIYFGSDRSGDWQIWKIPSAGGAPMQVTKSGGFEAFESIDGAHLYYAKLAETPGIWHMPVKGGDEVRLIDHGRETSWGVTERGLVLMDKFAKPRATIEYFSFDSARLTRIAELSPGLRFDAGNPSFAVSRDGQWILYVQYDQWGSDIHMLERSR